MIKANRCVDGYFEILDFVIKSNKKVSDNQGLDLLKTSEQLINIGQAVPYCALCGLQCYQ